MNYIQDGGNLIVQYNTNNQIGSVKANIGPYNFNISRTRVTEENAAVHILLPNNPALNYPNKITTPILITGYRNAALTMQNNSMPL